MGLLLQIKTCLYGSQNKIYLLHCINIHLKVTVHKTMRNAVFSSCFLYITTSEVFKTLQGIAKFELEFRHMTKAEITYLNKRRVEATFIINLIYTTRCYTVPLDKYILACLKPCIRKAWEAEINLLCIEEISFRT